MYKLLLKAEAVQDMKAAFEWYEDKKIGYYDRISRNPEHFKAHRNQRIAVMYRFPYKIVYEI